jgi:hypothetical protein
VSFRLQRAVRPLVRAALLGVRRHDALDAAAEPDPPNESRESLARPGLPNELLLSERIACGRPYSPKTR